ncbi:UNVERIFIED_ORG: hypothetical protein GGD59_002218 [Rhizobium esperanzae]
MVVVLSIIAAVLIVAIAGLLYVLGTVAGGYRR